MYRHTHQDRKRKLTDILSVNASKEIYNDIYLQMSLSCADLVVRQQLPSVLPAERTPSPHPAQVPAW